VPQYKLPIDQNIIYYQLVVDTSFRIPIIPTALP